MYIHSMNIQFVNICTISYATYMTRHRIGFASFSVDNLVLGLLMQGGRHGYSLYQEYQKTFGSIWQVGQSKFYAALDRLDGQGLAASTTEDQSGRPARRVYTITDEGREQFLAWLYAPVLPIRAIRVEFVAKLRFFQLLALDGVAQLLRTQIRACRDELDGTVLQRQAVEDPIDRLTFRFREQQLEAYLTWLYECTATLAPEDDPGQA